MVVACASFAALAIAAAAPTPPHSLTVVTRSPELVVASGCDRPPTETRGRIFHIDPARGSEDGDGSTNHPWRTLAEVMKRHQQDFQAGDRLLLSSGEHGGANIKQENAGFVTIAAAPGAEPRIDGLVITDGAAHWIFEGLVIQQSRQGKLVIIAGGSKNIIFDHNRISSADNVQDWSPDDWAKKGAGAFRLDERGGTRCITITNNDIRNVTNPIDLFSSDVLFAGNKIDHFGGDGIDYSGDNLVISHNVLTNAVGTATGQHIDGMQGFTPGGAGRVRRPYNHVTIDGNVLIRQADPNLALPVDMQGISAFDDDWNDLTVTNNIVVTNTYSGINFASVHHGLIANNTVVSDEHRSIHVQPGGKPVIMTGELVYIAVGNTTHQGSPSNDVVLRNNISQSIMISTQPGAIEADHNTVYHLWALRSPFVARGINDAGGAPTGKKNRGDPGIVKGFVAFDPKTLTFNLHLRAKSPAIGAGNDDRAPTQDADGVIRKPPIDLGAYAYVGS
jgi:hypothetical protein